MFRRVFTFHVHVRLKAVIWFLKIIFRCLSLGILWRETVHKKEMGLNSENKMVNILNTLIKMYSVYFPITIVMTNEVV